MHKSLENLSVIVTGAARGIGKGVALGLLKSGARVAMVDILPNELAATAEEGRAIAGSNSVVAIRADITQQLETRDAVARTLDAFGQLDGLVNNAGIGRFFVRPDHQERPIRFWDLTPEQWRRFVDVNLHSFFYMTQSALVPMLQQGHGRIITVTTGLFTMTCGGSIGYGGTKAGVEASMSALANDLKGTSLTANIVVPGGPVNTPAFVDDGKVDRAAFLQPEVMVPPIRWLLSKEASTVSGNRYVAGKWDPLLPDDQASAACGNPIAWPQLAERPIIPKGMDFTT